ncbi:hypothetical protein FQN60_014368 [Etheostoma spectabile]|uniref:E3 ubiquitin-protein ligase RFWD3-like WD40 domain-containing protein n=1 Tax=Etheostoma spectabile TaxID=54343 RepID=A0A5J5DAC2_9PERO|nr:hypothetical protein FQN60_014368 [Etheostoma spectabile]
MSSLLREEECKHRKLKGRSNPSLRCVLMALNRTPQQDSSQLPSCSCAPVQTFSAGSSCKLLTKNAVFKRPDGGGTLVCAGDEASNSTMVSLPKVVMETGLSQQLLSRLLLTRSSYVPGPQVWDAGSGSLLQKLPADLPVLDISPFSVNGEHFLASLTEKMLKLYSVIVEREEKKKKTSATLLLVPIFPTAPERSGRLTGSVKMADCIRVPLLLLSLCILSSLHPIHGENHLIGKLTVNADNPQKQAGGAGPAAGVPGAAERSLVAGASLPRRRSTGWKLAEEGVCREDLTRLCPKHSWNNNLAVLECLQDKKEVTLHYRDNMLWLQGNRQGVPAKQNR